MPKSAGAPTESRPNPRRPIQFSSSSWASSSPEYSISTVNSAPTGGTPLGRLTTTLSRPRMRKNSSGPSSFETTECTSRSSARRRVSDVRFGPVTRTASRVRPVMKQPRSRGCARSDSRATPAGWKDAAIR